MPRLLNPIYAEESEAGTWIFGYGPDDYNLIKQGYACPHCMEVFAGSDGVPITRIKCPVCQKPTAIGDITQAFTETPEDWVAYLKHREQVLSEPSGRE